MDLTGHNANLDLIRSLGLRAISTYNLPMEPRISFTDGQRKAAHWYMYIHNTPIMTSDLCMLRQHFVMLQLWGEWLAADATLPPSSAFYLE